MIALRRLAISALVIAALVAVLAGRQAGSVRHRVSPEALEALCGHDWPGNVRELFNVLERAQILAEDHLISLDDLPEW